MRMLISTLVAGAFASLAFGAGPVRAADKFPNFNVEHNCKLETSETTGVGETLQGCIDDELRARQELEPNWSKYPKADQTSCVRETSLDGTPSYVELQICLEMSRDSGH
jgi:hypothetical protein